MPFRLASLSEDFAGQERTLAERGLQLAREVKELQHARVRTGLQPGRASRTLLTAASCDDDLRRKRFLSAGFAARPSLMYFMSQTSTNLASFPRGTGVPGA